MISLCCRMSEKGTPVLETIMTCVWERRNNLFDDPSSFTTSDFIQHYIFWLKSKLGENSALSAGRCDVHMIVQEGMFQSRKMRKCSSGDHAQEVFEWVLLGLGFSRPSSAMGLIPCHVTLHMPSHLNVGRPLTHCPCKFTLGSVTLRTFFRGSDADAVRARVM